MSFPNKIMHDWNQTLTHVGSGSGVVYGGGSDDDSRQERVDGSGRITNLPPINSTTSLDGNGRMTRTIPTTTTTTANKKQRVVVASTPPTTPQMEMAMQLYNYGRQLDSLNGRTDTVNRGHSVSLHHCDRSLRQVVYQSSSASMPQRYSNQFSTTPEAISCMPVEMFPAQPHASCTSGATSNQGSFCFDPTGTQPYDVDNNRSALLHRLIGATDTSSLDPAFLASVLLSLQSQTHSPPPSSAPTLLPGLLSHPVSQYLSMTSSQRRHQLQLNDRLVSQVHHANSNVLCDLSTFPFATMATHESCRNGPLLVGQKRSLDYANEHTATVIAQSQHNATGIPSMLPALLSCPSDQLRLTPLQSLLREQLEVFEAQQEDTATHIRGRNKAIKLGQVGIRCRHCSHLPIIHRGKGSTYYPTSVWGLYQASQNMCQVHLASGLCAQIPPRLHAEFTELIHIHRSATGSSPTSGAGRSYWAGAAHEMGLVDTNDGIYFIRNLPHDAQFPASEPNNPGAYRKTKPKETK